MLEKVVEDLDIHLISQRILERVNSHVVTTKSYKQEKCWTYQKQS